MNEKYTAVRITVEGREKLRQLAMYYRRSMAQQMEWLIEQEWHRTFARQRGGTRALEGHEAARGGDGAGASGGNGDAPARTFHKEEVKDASAGGAGAEGSP